MTWQTASGSAGTDGRGGMMASKTERTYRFLLADGGWIAGRGESPVLAAVAPAAYASAGEVRAWQTWSGKAWHEFTTDERGELAFRAQTYRVASTRVY